MVIRKNPSTIISKKATAFTKKTNKPNINDYIDDVMDKNPTLNLRFDIIAEKVNQIYGVSVTKEQVENHYDSSIVNPVDKLQGLELDEYLKYKHAGLI